MPVLGAAPRSSDPKETRSMLHRIRPVTALVLLVCLGWSAVAEAATPQTTTVLTLRECVRIALESSASLRIRDEERLIAEQDVKAAWGAFLPDLTVSASYSKSNRTDFDLEDPVFEQILAPIAQPASVSVDTIYIPATVPTGDVVTGDVEVESTSKDFSGSANLTLFDGLANINNLKAAKTSRRAAEVDRAWSREMVIQNVAVAYYELLRYMKLEEVAAETRDQAAAELQRTETYFRLGSAAKSEVLQQRVRLEQTKYDLVVAQNQVQRAIADLVYAMNQPLADEVSIDTSPLATEMALEPVDSLYAEAIESRLDLRSTRLSAEAADHQASAAAGPLLPRLDVFGRYSRSNNESPYRFGSQTSESWVYGAQVSLDIFNRYQNWTSRSRARAQARIAEYQLEQAELDAQLEVRQYHNAMRNAMEKHKVATETIVQAEEELRLARERFRVGAGTQLDRITAEVSLASARAGEVQAVCDYLIARVQLYRAVGRLNRLGG
ncbi:hypothetical protein GF314_03690 [bacterium]|nr:hypothetical protein [bacterium]